MCPTHKEKIFPYVLKEKAEEKGSSKERSARDVQNVAIQLGTKTRRVKKPETSENVPWNAARKTTSQGDHPDCREEAALKHKPMLKPKLP